MHFAPCYPWNRISALGVKKTRMIGKFFTPHVFLMPPLKGFQLELGTDARDKKIMMGLPGCQNSFKIGLEI